VAAVAVTVGAEISARLREREIAAYCSGPNTCRHIGSARRVAILIGHDLRFDDRVFPALLRGAAVAKEPRRDHALQDDAKPDRAAASQCRRSP